MTTKVDKSIGKQKFKAKRQYTVVVEFEGEAFTKDDFESLLPTELELKDHDEYGENGGRRPKAAAPILGILEMVHMACTVGCTWLTYSLCAALYGLYSGYIYGHL